MLVVFLHGCLGFLCCYSL